MAGCRGAAVEPKTDLYAQLVGADTGALLPHVNDIDATTRPGDVFEYHVKLRTQENASLFNRRIAACEQLFRHLQPRWQQATPEELINGMRFGDAPTANELEYLFWRDGNKCLEKELSARGEAARPALLQHTEDERTIFSGSSGMFKPVSYMCQDMLKNLDASKAKR